jgi:NAD(P)-dependent dehydrogenase (short-subunit alcohol dehydrogenase family)
MKKTALISGANKGIGLETARQLGNLGYKIYVGSRDEARGNHAVADLNGEGIEAVFAHLDMTDSKTFQTVADQIEKADGHLDVLINNAGASFDKGVRASLVSMAQVRESFEVNFFSQIELTQTLLPLLLKSDAGRIVNVSSILGSLTLNSDPESPIGDWRSLGYNGSKTALNAFTAILSYDLRDTKIKVNSGHPGWVKTELGGEGAMLELKDGAATNVWLATLPADGPTGGFFHMHAKLPW